MVSKVQRCSHCDAPTGRCEDDSLRVDDSGDVLCEDCYADFPECDHCGDRFRKLWHYATDDGDGLSLCDSCRKTL